MNDVSKTIGWADKSWNPLTGCRNTCPYCYARRIATRFQGTKAWPNGFEPTWHPERLIEPFKVKKPSRIFVCSVGELFGPWVPGWQQMKVLSVVLENPQHTFIFLTKYPGGMFTQAPFPSNCWMGVTVTNTKEYNRARQQLTFMQAGVRFISCEPLLERIVIASPKGFAPFGGPIDWVIIGAQTNPLRETAPNVLKELMGPLDLAGVPVFMKDNLKQRWFPRIVLNNEQLEQIYRVPFRQEFPLGADTPC